MSQLPYHPHFSGHSFLPILLPTPPPLIPSKPPQHSFTATFPSSGLLGGDERLRLCFPDRATAAAWQRCLREAARGGGAPVSPLARASSAGPSQTSSGGGAAPATLASVERRSAASSASASGSSARRGATSASAAASASAAPASPRSEDPSGAGGERRASEEPSAAPPRRAPPPPKSARPWRLVQHVNGMTLYREEESPCGEGGALMLSASVRGSPSEAFRALLSLHEAGNPSLLLGCETARQAIDARTTVSRHRLDLGGGRGGLLGRWAAPRELTLLRTWRRDADGTLIVLYQSVQASAQQQASGLAGSARPQGNKASSSALGRLWAAARMLVRGSAADDPPVSAQVPAAGFTLAPLLPRHRAADGSSPECLVTLLMKLDPGGWLRGRGWPRPVGRFLHGLGQEAWVAQAASMMAVLRDRLDHARFVAPSDAGPGDDLGELFPGMHEGEDGRAPGVVLRAPATGRAPPGAALLKPEGSWASDADGEEPEESAVARHHVSLHQRSPSSPLKDGIQAARAASLTPLGLTSASPSFYLDAREEGAAGGDKGLAGARPIPAVSVSSPRASSTPSTTPHPPATPPTPTASDALDEWARAGTTPAKMWECPGAAGLRVRGASYLADRVKVPTCPPAFDLVASDLVALDEPLYHIARFLPSVKLSKSPFLLVFQLMLPCSPPLALCCCWEAPLHPERASLDELLAATRARDAQAPSGGSPEQLEASARAFWVGLRDWLAGDGVEADASRSRRLKLIPHIVRGSWVVKRAVGTTPVLLGQKLLTKYYRGPNYFEVDVDVTSNPVANSITGLVINAITSLVVDLAFLIEGQDERALPERLLGSIRYNHLRLKGCPYLQVDGEKGTIVRDGALEDRA